MGDTVNALWKIYLSGKWGWEANYGFVVGPYDDLRWTRRPGIGSSMDMVLVFDQVPPVDVLKQAADAFDKWFDGVFRPSRWERDASLRRVKKNRWWEIGDSND